MIQSLYKDIAYSKGCKVMASSDIKNLQQLINNHKKRLQILQEQEALYGISVDPRIPVEIKIIEEKIGELESEVKILTPTQFHIRSKEQENSLLFEIVVGDVLYFKSDVLALKFADALYGVDRVVAKALGKSEADIATFLPKIGSHKFIESLGRVKSNRVLFLNVGDLFEFMYEDIRRFSADTLKVISAHHPNITHLSMTIHGVGYGLDESEAMRAQIAGYFDAIESGNFPQYLQRVTLVERDPERAKRLEQVLINTLSMNPISITRNIDELSSANQVLHSKALSETGRVSLYKPLVIAAFPTNKDVEDVFYYGVQSPVNAASYLCENIDLTSPTAETLERVTSRIETATLVVAEITKQNPYSFFIIGYSCAKGKSVMLFSQTPVDNLSLSNNLQCITYNRIRDIEMAIRDALK